ncbi:hypothetical protein P5P86_16810 [Nocardioides sp. BP30]|uniref:hypothetical protein n=1 Tax=Nocardioides sp. BP30 TaxID=3036374 RepID=UPI002468FE66|nr:hypothetical protein [Nocardioides sp. BP30]WGL51610.1 hypothetical protein P5P86_16810 [Nocardioides sp. BP30]
MTDLIPHLDEGAPTDQPEDPKRARIWPRVVLLVLLALAVVIVIAAISLHEAAGAAGGCGGG